MHNRSDYCIFVNNFINNGTYKTMLHVKKEGNY